MSDFWITYQKDLKSGYFRVVDGKDALKPEFIVDYPKELARQFKHYKKNKLSQLWKFYDHAMRIQDSLQGGTLDLLKAELCELQPYANYALERETITSDFKKFIDLNVQYINNNADLGAFVKHFQSVIAYLPRQNQK